MGNVFEFRNTITRLANATQYAVGDQIASRQRAKDPVLDTGMKTVLGNGSPMIIRRVVLSKDDGDQTSALFRLHLFSANPYATPEAKDTGDNAPLNLAGADPADYLGAFDFDMATPPEIYDTGAGNAATGVPLVGSEIMVPHMANEGPFGLLEARGTYTPHSGEVFTIKIQYLPG